LTIFGINIPDTNGHQMAIQFPSDIASRCHLRSTSRHHLLVPRHNLSTYGRRALSVAGPAAWNSLCDKLREPSLAADNSLRLTCLQSTRAYSTLEVLHIMRYINLLTYSLYLLQSTWPKFEQNSTSKLKLKMSYYLFCK